MPISRFLTLLTLAVLGVSTADAQNAGSAAPPDTNPVAVVRSFVDAFNAKDLDAMMSRVAPEMVWLNVVGDSVAVGGRSANAFRQLLSAYFRQVPSARSELLEVRALGPWVTTHERTRWSASSSGTGGQSSVVVYEIRAGLLRRVWYYPAESSEGPI